MKEWEYKVVHMKVPDIGPRVRELNNLGRDGWELVTVGSYRKLPVFYLKKLRKKED